VQLLHERADQRIQFCHAWIMPASPAGHKNISVKKWNIVDTFFGCGKNLTNVSGKF
jgi:hypothetical protein